jgi:NitT/TauT family transport system substrate-binding protein
MRHGRLIALVSLTALLAAACGGATPGGGPAAAKGTGAAGHATRVTFVQSQNILSYAPAYVARAKGYLKQAGIDATFDSVKGDGPIYAALSSGSAQFGIGDAAGFLSFSSKGLDTEAVYALDHETIDVAVSRKWAEAHHVSRGTPLKQRVLALRGATIGYTSPGSISETLGEYLLAWAGLNPAKDATFAAIGGLAARQAALRSGQIQVYLSSPPGPEQAEADGFGYVLIPSKQLPGFSHVYNEVLTVSKAWAAKHADVVRKVTAAFARSTQLLLHHPNQAEALLQGFFPKVTQPVLKESTQFIDGALIPGGRMTAADWKRSAQLLIKIHSLKGEVDTSEGKYWTNRYLGAQ